MDLKSIKSQLETIKNVVSQEIPEEDIEFKEAMPFYVKKDELLNEIYIETDNENIIIDGAFNINILTILIGPRGSGKTTNIIKVFSKNLPSRCRYLRIDFPKEEELKNCLNDKDKFKFMLHLRGIINKKMLTRFYDKENSHFLRELCKELLKGPSKDSYASDVFEDFVYERQPLLLYHQFKAVNKSYEEWIEELVYPEINVTIDKMILKLEFKHLIWGLYKLSRCNKFILIFDNVDIVEPKYQEQYFSIAAKIHKEIETIAKCIIVIREENMSKTCEFSNQEDSSLDVRYFDDGTLKPFSPHKDINIIPVNDTGFKELINKRIKFAKKKYMERNIIPDKENEEKIWKLIEDVTQNITDAYVQEKFSFIANSNIRKMLEGYYSLLEYILCIENSELVKYLSLFGNKKSYIFTSIFYSWLINKAGVLKLHLYDLTKLYRLWEEKRNIGCFPQHLILTYLYNRKLERKQSGQRYNYTLAKELIDALVSIGFNPVDVKKAIIDLFFEDPTTGHMIEIIQKVKKDRINHSDIDDDDQIWILPRGEIACTDIIHKYTYLIESMENKKEERGHYSVLKIDESHIREDIIFLTKIANMHLQGLLEIKKSFPDLQKMNWLRIYKNKFCIRGQLQLLFTIYNHSRYLKRFYGTSKRIMNYYYRLEKEFREQIDRINDFNTYEEISIPLEFDSKTKIIKRALIIFGKDKDLKVKFIEFLRRSVNIGFIYQLDIQGEISLLKRYTNLGYIKDINLVFILISEYDVGFSLYRDESANNLKFREETYKDLLPIIQISEAQKGDSYLLYRGNINFQLDGDIIKVINVTKDFSKMSIELKKKKYL